LRTTRNALSPQNPRQQKKQKEDVRHTIREILMIHSFIPFRTWMRVPTNGKETSDGIPTPMPRDEQIKKEKEKRHLRILLIVRWLLLVFCVCGVKSGWGSMGCVR